MPDNKNRIAAVLAIMAMSGFLLAFFVLGWMPVPAGNKDYLNQALIALIGLTGTAFGYYLGSSVGRAQKNALLANQPPPPPPPDKEAADAGFIRLHLLLPLMFATMLCASLWLMTGCATTATGTPAAVAATDAPMIKAGKTLLATKSAIITVATTVNQLCVVKQLAPDICKQAKATYEATKPIYDTAVDSYLLLSQGGDPAQYEQNLLRLTTLLADLQQIAGGVK